MIMNHLNETMSARPRPVTATVTKPPWMQVPFVDAAVYRRHSLSSSGSTASLTSVLDHDSYISEPNSDEERKQYATESCLNDRDNIKPQHEVHFYEEPKHFRKIKRHTIQPADDSNGNLRSTKSVDSGLSAWEMWLIQKAKDEKKLRKAIQQQKRLEKQEKLAREKEKQLQTHKAEELRQEWLHKKIQEEKENKKAEKSKRETEKRLKQSKEELIRNKAAAAFAEWKRNKEQEEKDRKQKEKEKEEEEQEERRRRLEQAQKNYQDWLKKNKQRPQSAPSQQQTGYNNCAPYPKPSYVNPIPWQHPEVPKVKQDKPKKVKSRRYVWNPAKYF